MMKQKEEILYAIKEVIAQVMPTGARVVLLGSQVRNDAREDSDWDILILLDKEKLEEAIIEARYAFIDFIKMWNKTGLYYAEC